MSTMDDVSKILDLVKTLTNIDITLDASAWAGEGTFGQIVENAKNADGKVTWTDVLNAADTAVVKSVKLGDNAEETKCVEYTLTTGEGETAKTITLSTGQVMHTTQQMKTASTFSTQAIFHPQSRHSSIISASQQVMTSLTLSVNSSLRLKAF